MRTCVQINPLKLFREHAEHHMGATPKLAFNRKHGVVHYESLYSYGLYGYGLYSYGLHRYGVVHYEISYNCTISSDFNLRNFPIDQQTIRLMWMTHTYAGHNY